MSEQVRLLVCATCKTIEEMDDYDGPQNRADEYDHVLNTLVSRHVFPGGDRHIGQLFRVDLGDWKSKQPEIVEQIKQQLHRPGEGEGLGSEFYQVKNTLTEDALTCWKQHGRRQACEDFKSSKKLLKPDTKADRRELGISEYRSNIHLCNYCPVASVVEQRIREAQLKKES